MIDYKIDVSLNKNCALCSKYHYTIMAYDDSRNSGWYSTGITGNGDTPEKAFAAGYERYLNYMEMAESKNE